MIADRAIRVVHTILVIRVIPVTHVILVKLQDHVVQRDQQVLQVMVQRDLLDLKVVQGRRVAAQQDLPVIPFQWDFQPTSLLTLI